MERWLTAAFCLLFTASLCACTSESVVESTDGLIEMRASASFDGRYVAFDSNLSIYAGALNCKLQDP